jgi:hypothetical protein
MAFTAMDRTVIEIRELLAKTQDKDKVVRVMQTRGMPPEEARDLVFAIYRENLSANRKTSLAGLIGCGFVTVLSGGALVATHGLIGALGVVALISFIGFLWCLVKFVTAKGYEVEQG